MATVYLKPTGFADSTELASGAVTDIDEGINSPGGPAADGDFITTSANQATGLIVIDVDNAPGDYGTFTSAQLHIRGTPQQSDGGDTNIWTCSMVGTQAPSETVTFGTADTDNSFTTKNTGLNTSVTPTAANIDGWQIQLDQTTWSADKGPDGSDIDFSAMEIELNYTESSGPTIPMVMHHRRKNFEC